jgi:hypothetical protein
MCAELVEEMAVRAFVEEMKVEWTDEGARDHEWPVLVTMA